jgi:hypothetical protein
MYNSIRPGKVWLDTNGKRIQAHGFMVFTKGRPHIIYCEKTKKYFAWLKNHGRRYQSVYERIAGG